MSSIRWRRQPNWFIDGENLSGLASDRNDGHDITHPIRHAETLFHRLGPRAYMHDLTMQINMMSSLQSGDYFVLDVLQGPNFTINVQGTKKTAGLPSGTITTYVDVNRAVGSETMPKITDTALSAGGFSAVIGKLVKITAGARSGTSFFTMKDLTAKTARISTPVLLSGSSGPVTGTRKVLAATDPYQVYDLPNIPLGMIRLDIAHNQNAPTINSWATFNSIGLNGNVSSELLTAGPYIDFMDCIITACFYQSDYYNGHNVLYLPNTFGGIGVENCASWATLAGGMLGGGLFTSSSTLYFDQDFLFQGCGSMGQLGGNTFTTGTCAAFDSTGSGVFAVSNTGRWGTSASGPDGIEALWGTNNTGYGFRCAGGSLIATAVFPTVNKGLGLGREVRVGATDKLWTDMPYTETVNGSVVGLSDY